MRATSFECSHDRKMIMMRWRFRPKREEKVERRPHERGEWRSDFSSALLSFLLSPALLPQCGNGGGRQDSQRVSADYGPEPL
jgi:hypothetical protein